MPTPAELREESSAELVDLLRERIAAAGAITFAEFMAECVGHPQYGYYTALTPRPGFEGDFLTGPETHWIFGQTLARQVIECWDRMGAPADFVVREEGAGSGTLARDVLDGIGRERPLLLETLSYQLSDISSARTEVALANLAEAGYDGQIAKATDAPYTGVLLANELLDAFPVHRLIVRDGTPVERWVTWQDDWFAEVDGRLSDPELVAPLAGLELVEGQRLEVSPAAAEWVCSAAAEIERGYAILIDYGYPAAELYDPNQRFDGLLRTYREHLVGDDPYRRIGRQDLTAHVDFTAMQAAAMGGGWDVLGLTSQAFFFAGLGIEQLLLSMQEEQVPMVDYLNARQTIMELLDPRGLGRFKVLALGKGVDATPPLRGLAFSL